MSLLLLLLPKKMTGPLNLSCAVLQRGGEKRKKESGLIRYAVVQLTELITERPPVTGRRRRVYAILF